MPLPTPSTDGPSARARLVAAMAGATPARTATVVWFPFAGAAGRFAGGSRACFKLGGGGGGEGARLPVEGICTALRRPTSQNKNSYGGAALLCLARRADGEGDGASVDTDSAGSAGDHHDEKKAGDLTKGRATEDAAAGGGDDGDKADPSRSHPRYVSTI